jgi:hypothetical protein
MLDADRARIGSRRESTSLRRRASVPLGIRRPVSSSARAQANATLLSTREPKEDSDLRRIGSNIRKKNSEERSHRLTKNIIEYSETETPKNDYPRRIVSPARPSPCCNDQNRISVGSIREVEGFKFCYKVCQKCGHAVKYFFPATESSSDALKQYRARQKYMAQ